jgi:hypothetical protein
MLRSLKSILGYIIRATDGDIGEMHDFLFDDHTWKIRYGVVGTGGWLLGRKVLLSPMSFKQPDWESQGIQVDLSKERVRSSPDIDTDMPVSRQQRTLLDGYYGWSAAAAAGGLAPVAFAPSPIPEAEQEELAALQEHADPHLRSAKEVTGYHIQASDGEIGHIDDFILEDEQWRVVFLVVDTKNWLPGRKVLISPRWAKQVNWESRTVEVDLTQDSVKNSPRYDPTIPINKEYEVRLYDYYGRPKDAAINRV